MKIVDKEAAGFHNLNRTAKKAFIDKDIYFFCLFMNTFGYPIHSLKSPQKQQTHLVNQLLKLFIGIKRFDINKPTYQQITRKQVDTLLKHCNELYEHYEKLVYTNTKGKLVPNIALKTSNDLYEAFKDNTCYVCTYCGYIDTSEDYCWYNGINQIRMGCPCCNKNTNPVVSTYKEHWEDIAKKTSFQFEADMLYEDILYVLDSHIKVLRSAGYQALIIEGYNLNWRGSSGTASCSLNVEELLNKITVRGDYTLYIEYLEEINQLEVTCAHHDATSRFVVSPAYSCCHSGDVISEDKAEVAMCSAKIVNTFFEDNRYEMLSEYSFDLLFEDAIYTFPNELAELARSLKPAMTVIIAEQIMDIVALIEDYQD